MSDRETTESYGREVNYWRERSRLVEDRLGRMASIACRGLVTPLTWHVNWNVEPKTMVPVKWVCPACQQEQRVAGACRNPACVPGEVARAFIAGAETVR